MLTLVAIVVGCALVVHSEPFFSIYETPQRIEHDGFPVETHHVTTSDGYILEMHRIPHGRNQTYTADRPVLFMMHGLTAASNCFVNLGSELAPAYNFADGGFDIWMGNARGTKSSRHHVTLDPDRDVVDFFDFSWEDIALYDLPAMIDYALATTNKENLYYIGHSQGGTVFLVLTSMKPEYQRKIQSAHLWAGVGYMNHFPTPAISALARFTDSLYATAVATRQVELFPPRNSAPRADSCVGNIAFRFLCDFLEDVHYGGEIKRNSDEGATNRDQPGASLKQAALYGQNIRDKAFARWSYGPILNLLEYGSRHAPTYDLSLIKINLTMHYTVNDIVLAVQDVLDMAAIMPNARVRKVARETFLHDDFVTATDAKELVTDYIVEALRQDAGL